MKWLVTFNKDFAIADLKVHLQQWKCTLLEDKNAIPLGESEAVVEVEGPKELDQLISSSDLDIKVYPSSKLEPFS